MTQRNFIFGVLAFVLINFSILVIWDIKKNEKFLGKEEPVTNWKWDDDWKSDGPSVPPISPQENPIIPEDPKGQQLTANSYSEAIQKSQETGKPILIFFTASWCVWCEKMQNETLKNEKVKVLMKNYILVFVDVDKNRPIAKKFDIENLPSCIITNAKEEKLKIDSGFKNSEVFSNWLNNPSFYNQSKKDIRPDKKEEPKGLQFRKENGKILSQSVPSLKL